MRLDPNTIVALFTFRPPQGDQLERYKAIESVYNETLDTANKALQDMRDHVRLARQTKSELDRTLVQAIFADVRNSTIAFGQAVNVNLPDDADRGPVLEQLQHFREAINDQLCVIRDDAMNLVPLEMMWRSSLRRARFVANRTIAGALLPRGGVPATPALKPRSEPIDPTRDLLEAKSDDPNMLTMVLDMRGRVSALERHLESLRTWHDLVDPLLDRLSQDVQQANALSSAFSRFTGETSERFADLEAKTHHNLTDLAVEVRNVQKTLSLLGTSDPILEEEAPARPTFSDLETEESHPIDEAVEREFQAEQQQAALERPAPAIARVPTVPGAQHSPDFWVDDDPFGDGGGAR